MNVQAVYDAVRAWLGLGPTEPVVITVETPVPIKAPMSVDAFDFRGGRGRPKPDEKASPLVRVKVASSPLPGDWQAASLGIKPPKPKTKRKKRVK